MKIIKKILIGLLIVFVVMQAFRPAKNNSNDTKKDITNTYPMPDSVKTILSKACYDCHSNNTRYPWYSEIQPAAWWLANHIKDGQKEINFNEFDGYRIAKKYKKMEECIKQIKEDEMPLSSYQLIHRDADLNELEKNTLLNWFNSIRDSLTANYPADSLIIKRKK